MSPALRTGLPDLLWVPSHPRAFGPSVTVLPLYRRRTRDTPTLLPTPGSEQVT